MSTSRRMSTFPLLLAWLLRASVELMSASLRFLQLAGGYPVDDGRTRKRLDESLFGHRFANRYRSGLADRQCLGCLALSVRLPDVTHKVPSSDGSRPGPSVAHPERMIRQSLTLQLVARPAPPCRQRAGIAGPARRSRSGSPDSTAILAARRTL